MGNAQKELSGIAAASFSVGNFILELIKLQAFWFVATFRYGIVFGIFPATKAVIDYYFQKFKEGDKVRILTFAYFTALAKKDLKLANILGWVLSLIFLILAADLEINKAVLGSQPIHIALIILMILAGGTFLFILPCVLRYELKTAQYFKQAFFMFLSSPLETIAILVGVFLAGLIASLFPILIAVSIVPLCILPEAWFTHQAMLKREKQASK